MAIIQIDSIHHPGVEVFGTLTEAQLRNALEPEKGIFIAESPKVIHVALNAGYEPVSLLCEAKHITGDAAPLLERCGDIPVYTGNRDVLASLTGYTLTRGVLCAMRRPKMKTLEEVVSGARRVAVLENIVDSTNMGAIFRSAAALGIDAVLLTPSCSDPLIRRCVRVSMGTVFQVPWAYTSTEPSDWPEKGIEQLHSLGCRSFFNPCSPLCRTCRRLHGSRPSRRLRRRNNRMLSAARASGFALLSHPPDSNRQNSHST